MRTKEPRSVCPSEARVRLVMCSMADTRRSKRTPGSAVVMRRIADQSRLLHCDRPLAAGLEPG
jgi:hypothetical protein